MKRDLFIQEIFPWECFLRKWPLPYIVISLIGTSLLMMLIALISFGQYKKFKKFARAAQAQVAPIIIQTQHMPTVKRSAQITRMRPLGRAGTSSFEDIPYEFLEPTYTPMKALGRDAPKIESATTSFSLKSNEPPMPPPPPLPTKNFIMGELAGDASISK